jgi:hypothetical protein
MWAQPQASVGALVVRQIDLVGRCDCVERVHTSNIDSAGNVVPASSAEVRKLWCRGRESGITMLQKVHDAVDPVPIIAAATRDLLRWISRRVSICADYEPACPRIRGSIGARNLRRHLLIELLVRTMNCGIANQNV